MTDEKDEGHAAEPANNAAKARQDRLKRALRENLKRRKLQERERADITLASSNRDDVSPHEGSRKKPGR